MGREETVFDREQLYREVWAEPVRGVAQRYGISDVGLRKICQKLGVPVPPLGWWAKVAAGKKPPVTPLRTDHKGSTRHVRSVYVDQHAPERGRRVSQLLEKTRPAVWPTTRLPESLEDCHPAVRRTGKSLRLRSRGASGLLRTDGKDAFEVCVSEPQKERSLRILEGVLRAFLTAGATLVPSRQGGSPVHLEVVGQYVNVSIEELLDRSSREPTPKERAEVAKYSWTRLDLRVYTPNGKLKLTVLDDTKYSNYLTASDGTQSKLNERISDLVERVWTKAVEKNVKSQMQKEESERWRVAEAHRAERRAARQAEMDRLGETEKRVQQWHRAILLRQYADALNVADESSHRDSKPMERSNEVAWIRNAADWLDPLIEKHWPLVDAENADE
jgi:hypothetical protein